MPSCHALQVLAVRDRVCMGECIDNQIPLTELALTEIVPTEEELNFIRSDMRQIIMFVLKKYVTQPKNEEEADKEWPVFKHRFSKEMAQKSQTVLIYQYK